MKKRQKALALLVLLLSLVSIPQVFASYRCLNTSCTGYLTKRRELAQCKYCTSTMNAYECTYCGEWYPICGNGHYNTAVGKSTN